MTRETPHSRNLTSPDLPMPEGVRGPELLVAIAPTLKPPVAHGATPHPALLALAKLFGQAAARDALAAPDVEGIETHGEG